MRMTLLQRLLPRAASGWWRCMVAALIFSGWLPPAQPGSFGSDGYVTIVSFVNDGSNRCIAQISQVPAYYIPYAPSYWRGMLITGESPDTLGCTKVDDSQLPPGMLGPAFFFNDAADDISTLQLQAQFREGERLHGSDQFVIQILRAGKVIREIASSGTGAEIRLDRESVALDAGVAYTIRQTRAPGSHSPATHYVSTLVCENRTGRGGPMRVADGSEAQITPLKDHTIHCSFRFAPRAPMLQMMLKTLGGTKVFTVEGLSNASSLNRGGGYRIGTNAEGKPVSGAVVPLDEIDKRVDLRIRSGHAWVWQQVQCFSADAESSTAPLRHFGEMVDDVLMIPASEVRGAADIWCTLEANYIGVNISGQVLMDIGIDAGIPHDAVRNGGESGLQGMEVALTNCAGQRHDLTVTRSDGTFRLDAAHLQTDQDVCVELPLPGAFQLVSLDVGNSPAWIDTNVPFTQLRWVHRASRGHSGLVFGVAPVSTLSAGGLLQLAPDDAMTQAFIYTNGSEASVTFQLEQSEADKRAGWVQLLYEDPTCDGLLQPDHALIAGPLPAGPGGRICLIAKVIGPPASGQGMQLRSRLAVREVLETPTLAGLQRVQELHSKMFTLVAEQGLSLRKEWRKVLRCPPSPEVSIVDPTGYSTIGVARPGESVEYRLTYKNPGAAPVRNVMLHDAVPAYTHFESAHCLRTPPTGISACAVTVQPLPGAESGAIAWSLLDDGSSQPGLGPNAGGSVSFCLRVQQ